MRVFTFLRFPAPGGLSDHSVARGIRRNTAFRAPGFWTDRLGAEQSLHAATALAVAKQAL